MQKHYSRYEYKIKYDKAACIDHIIIVSTTHVILWVTISLSLCENYHNSMKGFFYTSYAL